MPAKDKFHEAVKKALIREGWQITADPLHLRIGGIDMYIDLAAEILIAAEKEGRKIAIEIKSFVGASLVADFHMAIGQFVSYRQALESKEPSRKLYLAIPTDTNKTFFALPFIQSVIVNQNINLIVYDARQEIITKWIE